MFNPKLKIRDEYQKIITKEKLPIGKFSYETYIGHDIYFKKQDKTGLWNITVYRRLQGTPLERLMVISAFASIKRMEKIWYKDETIPFNQIRPQILNDLFLESQKSKEIAENVLCDIRNSLHYMFEVDFLLEKKYLSVDDITELTKHYQSTSMISAMFFQFLSTISALKKHNGNVTEFNEDLISLKRYELFQIIDTQKEILESFKITPNVIKDIFNLLYPDIKSRAVILELEQRLKEKGNEKCFILTEDSKSYNLTRTLFEANGFDFSETSILSYESCSQIVSVKLFSIFTKQRFPQIEIIVHRDRDYLTNDEINKLDEEFNKIGVNLFITDGTDIESHFVNKFHINKCHPEISIDEANSLIDQALKNVEGKSIDLLKKKEFGEKYKNKSSHLENSFIEIYSSNKFRFSHGKSLYKSLKSLIQTRIKKNPKLEVKSEFLKVNILEGKAKKIWK